MNMPLSPSAPEAAGLLDGYTHTIGGKAVESERAFPVIDPATGQPFALCPDASRAQLDAAVAAAARAQAMWRHTPLAARRDALRAFAAALRQNRDDLAVLLTREQGKPLHRAQDELDRAANAIDILTGIDIGPEVLRDDASGRVELHYRPLGVVGAITPWNVPIVLATPKIAQALYCGNTIIVKPSPYTPLTTLELGRLARDVLPAGVLNVLAGGNELGQWITEHPGIAKISFTGSVATGKRVLAGASSTIKRVTLELGGNDAAIVLDDVQPREIAPRLFWAAFHNSGQICMAIKRLYVHEAVHDELCDALAQLAREVKVGNGLEEGVELGPVQNRMQFDSVQRVLADTRGRAEARILAGGHALDREGYFIAPTIVAGLGEGTPLVDEETFGPVLPILSFNDVDDAVERANRSRYGLGGSVWTQDLDRGAQIAQRLEVGTAWVNHHLGTDMLLPFGGAKESGLGREYSGMGLKGYMEPTVLKLPAAVRSIGRPTPRP
ncbi:MAG: aldehyde dehydrogenase family protein [Pigmentiphaga sp.]|uniref:aldehyde dehydrogenase family protein n=1 Tax=Pigmentiphaga sp. TaxID=1977564 RepID=UPI0029BEF09A|nr:aldehyde dehydrogenase family protein [Pigmentiphaga sp.]MDX3904399.1 aldehyde dehydrogenase family protein [Pigmentiphaga sp.]